jgi:hypothetical protein
MAQKTNNNKQRWVRSGGSSIKSKTRFNWRKYLPIILVVAALGGLFVWRSFAQVKLYPYQYSVYQCDSGKFDKAKINPDDKCLQSSAEAITFRLYDASSNKTPDTKGYQYWVQKLAGDRTQPSEASASLINGLKSKNNTQYVEALYNNAFGRKADTRGKVYWKSKLDKKQWNRERVLAHFAASNESVSKNKAAFANFLIKAPQVKVVQTAVLNRDKQLYTSAINSSKAKKQSDSIPALQTAAKQAKDSAVTTAKKNSISSGDLTSMQNNDKTVRDNLAKIEKVKTAIRPLVIANKVIYSKAKDVEDYSPDISAKAIKKNYDDTQKLYKGVDDSIKALGAYLIDIATNYNQAEDKYEAVAANNSNSTGTQIPDINTDTGTIKCPKIQALNKNSPSKCIEWAEKWYNRNFDPDIAVNGEWGPDTERAILYRAYDTVEHLFARPEMSCNYEPQLSALNQYYPKLGAVRVRHRRPNGLTRTYRIDALNCYSVTDGWSTHYVKTGVCKLPYRAVYSQGYRKIIMPNLGAIDVAVICYKGYNSDLTVV